MYVTRVGINTDSDFVGYEWNIRCNNEGRGERQERAKLFVFLGQSVRPFATIHWLFRFCHHFCSCTDVRSYQTCACRTGADFSSFFHTLTSASVCLVLSSHLITVSSPTVEFNEKMIHSSLGNRFVYSEIELKTGNLFILLCDHRYYYYYYRISHFSLLTGKYSSILGCCNQQD